MSDQLSSSSSAADPRTQVARRRVPRWSKHPGVRWGAKLTPGERAADLVRNGMGSWTFVFVSLIFLVVWMVENGHHGFDPYPFILLNLVLSCVSAMQGAILLIAAKREEGIASELAEHTFDIDHESLELARQIRDLTVRIERLTAMTHEHVTGNSAEDISPTSGEIKEAIEEAEARAQEADAAAEEEETRVRVQSAKPQGDEGAITPEPPEERSPGAH